MISETSVLWSSGALLAGIIWGMRLEGKVLAHDRELQQLRSDMNTAVGQVREDLRYIRDRIDRALGTHP